jgi:predicted phosphodiesterase
MSSKAQREDAKWVADGIEVVAKELKIAPQDVSYRQFINRVKEHCHDEDNEFDSIEAQGWVKNGGGFKNIKDSAFKPVVTEEAVRVTATARSNRKEAKGEAERSLFLSSLQDTVGKYVSQLKFPAKYPKVKSTISKRTLVSVLSDLHFGSDLDGNEVPLAFGVKEEARALAQIAVQVGEYKTQHRDDTELVVLLIGDLIESLMHDRQAGAPKAEQICRAIFLLTQHFTYLSTKFGKITVLCCSGNHDRDKERHSDRATSGKWDSYSTVICFAVKEACKRLENVRFEIPLTPYVTHNAYGNHIMAAHGDNMLNIGNPGSNLNVAKASHLTNGINASRKKGSEFSVFVIGHTHTGSLLHLDNGTAFVTNGCLVPPNGFVLGMSKLSTNMGQWVFEAVPGYAFGDSRFIRINENVFTDSSLNAIIRPFQGF